MTKKRAKERAKEIVKNLIRTIQTMVDTRVVSSEQFPPARADKKKLSRIAGKLISKYKLNTYKNKLKIAITE